MLFNVHQFINYITLFEMNEQRVQEKNSSCKGSQLNANINILFSLRRNPLQLIDLFIV